MIYKVVRAIDTTMVHTPIGVLVKYIVEEEQLGKTRVGYGDYLILELSNILAKEFGTGFSKDTLENAQQFYVIYTR